MKIPRFCNNYKHVHYTPTYCRIFLIDLSILKTALTFTKILITAQFFESQIIFLFQGLSFPFVLPHSPPPKAPIRSEQQWAGASAATRASHPEASRSLKRLERLFQRPHEQLRFGPGFFRKQKCFTFWCRKSFLVDFRIGFLKLLQLFLLLFAGEFGIRYDFLQQGCQWFLRAVRPLVFKFLRTNLTAK